MERYTFMVFFFFNMIIRTTDKPLLYLCVPSKIYRLGPRLRVGPKRRRPRPANARNSGAWSKPDYFCVIIKNVILSRRKWKQERERKRGKKAVLYTAHWTSAVRLRVSWQTRGLFLAGQILNIICRGTVAADVCRARALHAARTRTRVSQTPTGTVRETLKTFGYAKNVI